MARKNQPSTDQRQNYIREWIDFRGYTQSYVAERIGMSEANLSRIISGKHGYRDDGLVKLAEVLGCDKGDLLSRDPRDPRVQLWNEISQTPPEEAERLRRVVQAYKSAS